MGRHTNPQLSEDLYRKILSYMSKYMVAAMKDSKRYLDDLLLDDALASHKMAFVSGPRQSGKTTLAEKLLHRENCSANYFNWDDDDFRRLWTKSPKALLPLIQYPTSSPPLVVLDEIHKFSRSKNSLKGFYDLHREQFRLLVTGSARLDFYRRSGDSLAGRFLPYRLYPFTFGEVVHIKSPPQNTDDFFSQKTESRFDLRAVLELGGFPDPLFTGNSAKAQRWWQVYRRMIIRDDLRDLKAVRDLQLLESLVSLLPERVGSGLSYESLRQDLRLSFATVKDWISMLEALYLCFTIRPYSRRLKDALQREPKLYFFHWPAVKDPGPRFENLIAVHLLKSCHAWTDAAHGEFELHYIRDKYKREVDFLVTREQKPWLLLEVKTNSTQISPHLIYYAKKIKPLFTFQLVSNPSLEKNTVVDGVKINLVDTQRFLNRLN